MSTPQKSVVIIGLSNPGPEAKFTKAQLRQMIDDEAARFTAIGWYAEQVFIEDPNDYKLSAYRELMASRPWTIVALGFGIRGQMRLTGLFENLVNIAVETVQPAPKFVFQGAPNDVYEGAERTLGPSLKD